MEYKIGNSKKVISIGETIKLACPKCNEKVNMSVFSNGNIDIIPKLPLIKSSTVYFLICPNCSSIFGINESVGDIFKKGEKLAIGNYDLKELDKYDL